MPHLPCPLPPPPAPAGTPWRRCLCSAARGTCWRCAARAAPPASCWAGASGCGWPSCGRALACTCARSRWGCRSGRGAGERWYRDGRAGRRWPRDQAGWGMGRARASTRRPPHLCMPPGPQSLAASQDGLFMRLARQVFEASRAQQLRFQGVYVGGGVDEVRSWVLVMWLAGCARRLQGRGELQQARLAACAAGLTSSGLRTRRCFRTPRHATLTGFAAGLSVLPFMPDCPPQPLLPVPPQPNLPANIHHQPHHHPTPVTPPHPPRTRCTT